MSECRTNGTWHYLAGKAEFDKVQTNHRVKKGDWWGAGWYYVTKYSQRCPRNCCYDAVVETMTAAWRVDEVRDAMRELAEQLKDAKLKASEKP
jgi:hypothetical protein